VVAQSALVWCRELSHADVTRIQRCNEPPDRATLAGGIPTLEQHTYRRSEAAVTEQTANPEAQLEQPPLRFGYAPLRL
jgi:hypothetical protein